MHERTIELLPWFVNGRLEPGERREVEEHLASCASCRRELAETREAFAVFAAHLPAEALVELAAGEGDGPLPGGIDRGTASAHLDSCAVCREELDLLVAGRSGADEDAAAAFPTSGPAGSSGAYRWLALAAVLAAVVGLTGWAVNWQSGAAAADRIARLEQENAALRSTPSAAAGVPVEEMRRLTEESRRLQATARDLESRLAAKESQVAELEERAAAIGSVRANVPVIDLQPTEAVVRGGGAPAPPAVSGTAALVTLILNSQLPAAIEAAHLEVVAPSGKVLARQTGLKRNPTGDFTVALPRQLLAPGLLTLKLEAEGGSGSESFRLAVR